MRGHGLLRRILLHEEAIRQFDSEKEKEIRNILQKSETIIQTFMEGYHEKLEENHLFPAFEKSDKQFDLIQTLRTQHETGRSVTGKLQILLEKGDLKQPEIRSRIKNLLESFSAIPAACRPGRYGIISGI